MTSLLDAVGLIKLWITEPEQRDRIDQLVAKGTTTKELTQNPSDGNFYFLSSDSLQCTSNP